MSGTSPTSPDGAAGPSPLTVGKHFVKQYYQVLQTTPDQVFRFYQPSSFLSHAEGSTPTDPSILEKYEIEERWGTTGTKKGFTMEIGAIDAQTSINSSILLVVTGSVSSGKDPRKTFVHTFFLTMIPNTKRFYVSNDMLRLLGEQAEPSEDENTILEKEVIKADIAEETKAVEKAEDSPGGGVEETKEEAPEEEPEPVTEIPAVESEPVVEAPQEVVKAKEETPKDIPSAKDNSGGKGKRGKGAKPPQQPKQQPAPKVPGSWASLVASSPAVAPAPPVAPSPSKLPQAEKPEAAETKPPAPIPVPQPQEKATKENSGKGGQHRVDRHKRDPDCTLVIKNLPDGTKDADLVALFEPFAAATNGKILGTTVSVHRGLGFVDYDSVPPVMAAVAKHGEQKLELNGQVLMVDQKTAEQRARRNTHGGYRSGSPGNGGAYQGRGGGRSNQYRRGGGRGDRGGGRGDRDGGRGDRDGGRGGRGGR